MKRVLCMLRRSFFAFILPLIFLQQSLCARDEQPTAPATLFSMALQIAETHTQPEHIKALLSSAKHHVDLDGLGKHIATLFEAAIRKVCNSRDLWNLLLFKTRNKEILSKLPYIVLTILHEFTDQIYDQLRNASPSIGKAFINQLKTFYSFLKAALSTAYDQIALNYQIEICKPHPTTTRQAEISSFLKASNYPQLREFLRILVKSQIAIFSQGVSDTALQKILSENNIIQLFDNAVEKVLLSLLTPEEVAALGVLVNLSAFKKITDHAGNIAQQISEYAVPIIFNMERFEPIQRNLLTSIKESLASFTIPAAA